MLPISHLHIFADTLLIGADLEYGPNSEKFLRNAHRHRQPNTTVALCHPGVSIIRTACNPRLPGAHDTRDQSTQHVLPNISLINHSFVGQTCHSSMTGLCRVTASHCSPEKHLGQSLAIPLSSPTQVSTPNRRVLRKIATTATRYWLDFAKSRLTHTPERSDMIRTVDQNIPTFPIG